MTNRPTINDFLGDGFTLDKAHKLYLENTELWKYIQALDDYADKLEKDDEALTLALRRLQDLDRFDLDPGFNGEFTELEERKEADGMFIKWDDVQKLMEWNFLETNTTT